MGAYLLDQKKIIINLDLFVKNAIFEEKGIKLPNIYELFYYYVNKSYGQNLIPLNEYNLLTNDLQNILVYFIIFLRRHGQVVRQKPAKLLSPSSNLGVAYFKKIIKIIIKPDEFHRVFNFYKL